MTGRSRSRATARALKITVPDGPQRQAFRASLLREPNRYAYARQKLFEAVNVLVGGGSLGMRLAYAHQYLAHLSGHELPTELTCLLEPIREALQPDATDPTAAYRVNPVRLRQRGEKLARRIFELHMDAVGGLAAG
jgi:hypothetical protein